MQAAVIPGELLPLRPTSSEIRMALDFPNESELFREWAGVGGGQFIVDQLVETDPHFGEVDWRQGRVVDTDGVLVKNVEYRATMPGRGSRAFFSTLGWLMNESYAPRGWMAGREIVPEQAAAEAAR